MTMVAALAPEIRYSGSKDSAQWRGHAAVDEDRFKSYVATRVAFHCLCGHCRWLGFRKIVWWHQAFWGRPTQ